MASEYKKLTTLISIGRIIAWLNEILFGSFETDNLVFDTEVILDLRIGKYYASHNQAAEINFTEGVGHVNGGTNVYQIVADGNAINFPATWEAGNTNTLNVTAGKLNTITVCKINSTIFYFIIAES